MAEVKELAKQLRDAAEELEKSIVHEEPNPIDVQKEFLRFQHFRSLQNEVGKGN
jgi:hypothetical protein